jgi:hypothetical protein
MDFTHFTADARPELHLLGLCQTSAAPDDEHRDIRVFVDLTALMNHHFGCGSDGLPLFGKGVDA